MENHRKPLVLETMGNHWFFQWISMENHRKPLVLSIDFNGKPYETIEFLDGFP